VSTTNRGDLCQPDQSDHLNPSHKSVFVSCGICQPAAVSALFISSAQSYGYGEKDGAVCRHPGLVGSEVFLALPRGVLRAARVEICAEKDLRVPDPAGPWLSDVHFEWRYGNTTSLFSYRE